MSLTQIESCVEWAKKNGALIDDRLEFKFDSSRGVYAQAGRPITSEETLISVPRKLLITRALAEHSLKAKSPANGNPNALLQLFLAKLKFDEEYNETAAFFKPYLDILPSVSDINSPYFWTAEELSALKGTDLLIKTELNLRRFVAEWYEVVSLVYGADDEKKEFYQKSLDPSSFNIWEHINHPKTPLWHSFSAYLWATYIFSSRAFPELLFGSESITDINQAFLYPIVDFLNHSNGKKVKWHFDEQKNAVSYRTGEEIEAGEEIYNNYGNKSNEELLLNYGFAIQNNEFDVSMLTLRLPPGHIENLHSSGLRSDDININNDSVSFQLSLKAPMPGTLLKLFGVLNRLTSEQSVTTRSYMEGTTQLNSIIDQKLAFFKSASKLKASFGTPAKARGAKVYLLGQKTIYQEASDFLKRHQRTLLKEMKPTSFKRIIKEDKTFLNSLTLTFGITKYEDLISKGFLRQALLLWVVRASNESAFLKSDFSPPHFITDCFQDVKSTIVVEKDDVQEYMVFYKSLFPQLASKIPEVYGKGDWKIKSFIIAGTVLDRLSWTLPTSQEAFFFERKEYKT